MRDFKPLATEILFDEDEIKTSKLFILLVLVLFLFSHSTQEENSIEIETNKSLNNFND